MESWLNWLLLSLNLYELFVGGTVLIEVKHMTFTANGKREAPAFHKSVKNLSF